MITEMKMPKLGQTMEEGTIVFWKRQEGDSVATGEAICEIETDKARVDVEAASTGILRRIFVHAGQTVSVGTLIAVIANADDDISSVLQ